MNVKQFYRYVFVFLLSVFVFSGCGSDNGGGEFDEPDTTKPVITLNGASSVELIQGTAYTELGATVTDDRDVNVIVRVSGSVDINVVNSYTITYTAIDESGNAIE